MPSQLHEILLLLFRNRPELAPALLREALHVELPAHAETRVESPDLSQALPAQYHADHVVLLLDRDRQPVLGIIVEVQLRIHERKRFVWPMYVAGLRARRVPGLFIGPDGERSSCPLGRSTGGPGR